MLKNVKNHGILFTKEVEWPMENRKPIQLCKKLLLLGALCGLLALWVIGDLPCLFRHMTGIPCPGCGLSRAWLSALRLELSAAVHHHPMFWSIPVLAVYYLRDGRLFRNRKLNLWIFLLTAAGWLVSYIIRLVIFLGGGNVF